MTDTAPAQILRRSVARKAAAGMLILGVIAAAIWWFSVELPGAGTLMQLPLPGTNVLTHVWLRDRTLLLLVQRTQPASIEAVEWDVESGRTNVVSGIGTALRVAGVTNKLLGLDLSRDGQWLLLLGRSGTNGELVVVRVDGTRGHFLKAEPDDWGFSWLPGSGSGQWLSIGPRGQRGAAVVHSVDTTQTWEFPTALCAPINPVGTTEDGQILCAWQDPTNESAMIMATLNPTNFVLCSPPRHSGLPSRLSGVFQTLQLTRRGDLLAGVAQRANRLIGPVMSYLGWDRPSPTTIWTSRADGTGWREVGFVPSGDEVQEIRFTPDGRSLSVLRRGETNSATLWMISLK